ncbi:hypothetical protein [Burkholderia ambifaria]|uniref:hypothetical protein n=1 Tax=Burkholderia ambifaria TaxID=152480 RepID=UPI00158A4B29|nr:hypothetical protein [Burkholderia ambifaria]MBR8345810.1 hypothetical protein [Burkholderia ambifaria]
MSGAIFLKWLSIFTVGYASNDVVCRGRLTCVDQIRNKSNPDVSGWARPPQHNKA